MAGKRSESKSPYRLGVRKEKARDLIAKGLSNIEIATQLGVGRETVSRYRTEYESQIQIAAATNPSLLRDIVPNTLRALEELDKVRENAWIDYERSSSQTQRTGLLNTIRAAQSDRAKLYGLLGVKAEFAIHVETVRAQHAAIIKFLQENLCPADRVKLEEFLVQTFNDELASMPTADHDG